MAITVSNLRCERAVDPIGVGTATPRLSWQIDATSGETNVVQIAWQVETDGWDSGRVEGREQSVVYGWPHLGPREKHEWRVRVWTSAGDSEWSERATFETGLLDPTNDVAAQMIAASATTPVVRFSTTFDLDDDVASARLYLTSHGSVVSHVNGERVGEEVLEPGWTSFHKRLVLRTHDVTEALHRGTNEVDAVVAPSWFSGRFGLSTEEPIYGPHVGVLAQLEITTTTGETKTIATDTSWAATSTPFLLAEIYDGETFDARSPEPQPTTVTTIDLDRSILVQPAVAPVRETQIVQPASRTVIDGALQIDFGQNLVGYMRLTMRKPGAGAEIVMRHAELLGPDGRLYTRPLRSARATDTYIARGDAVETYEPTFTFHGFRFAEITGIDADAVDVEAVVIHSDLDRTGSFTCSDELVSKLHSNVVWGMRGNFVSVPTDCPQRDERLGWTGDAQVFSPTASYLYDCETFWENWLADLRADQRDDGCVQPVIPDVGLPIGNGACGWGDAACVIPWTTYVAYGDTNVLREAFASMRAWADYVFSRLDDMSRWKQDFQFGDWLDPDAPTAEPWKAKARFDLVASAYAYRSTDIVARTAGVLGDDATVDRYRARANALKDAWWTNYAEEAATTQTGCALAIEFGLTPDDASKHQLGDALVSLIRDADTHLATGFLGTPILLPALVSTGHLDVAYEVLNQTTCPSWLYTVLAGATTIWERWDALRPDGSVPNDGLGGAGAGMVSYNHYAYGAVADWMHTTVAGLAPDPDEPGYRHILVRPRPGGGLTSAGAVLATRFGFAASTWDITDGTVFTVHVSVPPNTSASVTLPDGYTTRVGSGQYGFTCHI